MRATFKLIESGEFERVLRLHDVKPNEVFYLREEDGSIVTDTETGTYYFVMIEHNRDNEEDGRQGCQAIPLIYACHVLNQIVKYFDDHFGYRDYGILPEDILRLSARDDFSEKGWYKDTFHKFIPEFTEPDKVKRTISYITQILDAYKEDLERCKEFESKK